MKEAIENHRIFFLSPSFEKKYSSCGYIMRRCVNAEQEWMENCSAPLNHRPHFPAVQWKQNGNAAWSSKACIHTNTCTRYIHLILHHCGSTCRRSAVKLEKHLFVFLVSQSCFIFLISRSGCFCQTSLHGAVIGEILIVQWQQRLNCLPCVILGQCEKAVHLVDRWKYLKTQLGLFSKVF